METLIGHESIRAYFEKAEQAGALHHAYMLVGPEGVGKRTFARLVSARLLGVKPEALRQHPDVFELVRGVDEKTGKTKKYISTDDIRGLLARLSEASFLGGYRVAFIDGAEDLSIGAANAFLKTLEEPKGRTILWLIVEDETRVPLTIRSRCQVVMMPRVRTSLISDALILRGVPAKQAEQVARISLGRPGIALEALESTEERHWFETEVERFQALFGKSFHEKLTLVEELFGDKTDHIGARETLSVRLGLWQLALSDIVRTSRGLPSRILSEEKKLPIEGESAVRIDKAIRYSKQYMEANVHPRLLIEHILQVIP